MRNDHDQPTDHPGLIQPPGDYVRNAVEDLGEEATWPEVQARAWELHQAEERDEDE